jgi:hypothetical protein
MKLWYFTSRVRFGTGNLRVGISHTVPIPTHTVPVMGTGTYRTIIYTVSNGYLTDLVGGINKNIKNISKGTKIYI